MTFGYLVGFLIMLLFIVFKLREDVTKGVYVENLSEFEVHTVSDILRLLIQVRTIDHILA